MSITTAQIRGARGILNWSQTDLSERTGISATSIGSIENGQTTPRASTISLIQKAFETGGIEFIGAEGVRLRTGDVRVFSGQAGFDKFFDYVYHSIIQGASSEICACNIEEDKFLKWSNDSGEKHIERMSRVENLDVKVLLKEGDSNFVASQYSEYRWLPKAQFSSVPFYTFNDELAIMLLESDPVIVLLKYPAVAEAYKLQFKTMWNQALKPGDN